MEQIGYNIDNPNVIRGSADQLYEETQVFFKTQFLTYLLFYLFPFVLQIGQNDRKFVITCNIVCLIR